MDQTERGKCIRVLEPSDGEAFRALRLKGLQECPSAFASGYEEEVDYGLERHRAWLSGGEQGLVLGAFAEKQLVGILGLRRERHVRLVHKGWLWGMYVDTEFRGRGIGRKLVAEALERAGRMTGLRQVNLGVNAANQAAFSLYQSMGFVEFGRELGFMIVDGELHDEVHMVRVL